MTHPAFARWRCGAGRDRLEQHPSASARGCALTWDRACSCLVPRRTSRAVAIECGRRRAEECTVPGTNSGNSAWVSARIKGPGFKAFQVLSRRTCPRALCPGTEPLTVTMLGFFSCTAPGVRGVHGRHTRGGMRGGVMGLCPESYAACDRYLTRSHGRDGRASDQRRVAESAKKQPGRHRVPALSVCGKPQTDQRLGENYHTLGGCGWNAVPGPSPPVRSRLVTSAQRRFQGGRVTAAADWSDRRSGSEAAPLASFRGPGKLRQLVRRASSGRVEAERGDVIPISRRGSESA
jgi:hypothetical protein